MKNKKKTKPEPAKSFKVSHEFVAHAKVGKGMVAIERNPFAPADPPPFVLPKGVPKLAQDDAMSQYSGWAGGGSFGAMVADGLTFMGYQYLAQLTQRHEYRVIAETIAGEMTRKWVRFKAGGDETDKSEKIKQIEAEFKRLKARDAFRRASELDGFFGIGHIFIGIGEEDYDLAEATSQIGDGWNAISRGKVAKGTPIWLQVIDPTWCYPSSYNTTDPLKPDWYKPKEWGAMGKRVHASRMLTFVAREVPDLLKPAYSFGGLSLSQIAKPYVDNWVRTRQSVADIVYKFSINVLKTQTGDALTGGAGSDLMSRVSTFVSLMKNQGVLAIDKELEDFVNVSAPLAGLDHLQAQAQEHMAAVSRIPLVKLTGISPSGLNASSEGEIKVFYDYIHDCQESHFRDHIHKLLGLVQLSLFGELDDEIEFDFLPLEELNDKEKADKRKVDADTDSVLVELGAISAEEVRQRVAQDADTPYTGLDMQPAPGTGEASPEQWEEALSGLSDAEGGASPEQWAAALGAEPEADAATPEQWAGALGAGPKLAATPEQWGEVFAAADE